MTSSVSLNELPSLNNGIEPMELSPDSSSSPLAGSSVEKVALNSLARFSTAENQSSPLNPSGTNGCVPSLPPEQIQNEPSLTREQQFLLDSLGIADPSKEENKEWNIERIKTILNSLNESPVLTASEKKAAFLSLSAEVILSLPTSPFYDFLQVADRHNLVLLFEDKISLPHETPFSQKVEAILEYLEKNKETAIDFCASSKLITGIPNEVCNLNNLRELCLHGVSIVSLPKEIGGLTNLENLHLHRVSIESLPETISDLTNLKRLFLDYVAIESLPKTIGGLTNLKSFFIFNTKIKHLPEEIGSLTSLEKLGLSSVPIESLPKTIGRLENLNYLSLSNTKIKHLPEEIGGLTNLKTLNLNFSLIESLPKTMTTLPEKFEVTGTPLEKTLSIRSLLGK